MRDAPWKSLVRDLVAAGRESPYLDRLRQRLDVEQAHHALEQEIVREMAAALGRAEDKVNAALLRLELAAEALAAAAGAAERQARAGESRPRSGWARPSAGPGCAAADLPSDPGVPVLRPTMGR